ncbi:hypothetical protein BGX38DRAFT_1276799 [Terfezia claveryi]|nr:hypothetical protein BGX38DRAFT_1276799 [Terfezia claveryi]
MPTDDYRYPVEDVLGSDLFDFLSLNGFLTWDAGTKLWILMGSSLTEEMFDPLIEVMVEEWIDNGITTMSEFKTLKGMNSDMVVAMVAKRVMGYLAALGV